MERRNSAAMSPSFLSEEQFLCSICLDMFNNPVSTPCGHSFCKLCIGIYWKDSSAYQCPLCKEVFHQMPDLHVNHTLKEITEQFKYILEADMPVASDAFAGSGGAVPEKHPPRPGPVSLPGDLFAEMKARFPKVSGVTEQIRPPPPPVAPKRHSLSSPAVNAVPLCTKHNQPLEMFCRTDQECICLLCMEREHHTHIAIPAKREWLIKKSQLGITEMELQKMIQARLKKVEEVTTSMSKLQEAAERETGTSVRIFKALVTSAEKMQAELLETIQMDRLAGERRAQGLIHELELEITALRKRSAAIEQFSQSEDYITFLKTFPALYSPLQTKDWTSVSLSSELCSAPMLQRVSQMVNRFQEEMRRLGDTNSPCLSPTVGKVGDGAHWRTETEVKGVQQYAVDVTLESSTAHPRLIISEDGKQIRCGDKHRAVPDTPERFDRVVCVLGQPGFSGGRHYWEVEVGGKTDWDLGVASCYSNRKGKIVVSPNHGYWFLSLRDKHEYAFRTDPPTILVLSVKPQKVGVFVDYEMGQISFYNVQGKTKTHIYTYIEAFSDTIYPFFSPCTNKSGRNDAPLVITPLTCLQL